MTNEQYYWYRRQQVLRAYAQKQLVGAATIGNLKKFNNLQHVASISDPGKHIPYVFSKENGKDDLDYRFAKYYFKKTATSKAGFCSGVLSRDLNFHGRNLDWYYNDEVTVVNHTSNEFAKHASIGFCLSHADQALVESGAEDDRIRIIPFNLDDGINDAGLTIQVNVMPHKDGMWTKPKIDDENAIPDKIVVRYVLDNFGNAEEAAEWVTQHAYYSQATYNYHWIVSDASKAFLIEDGMYKDITGRPYMTNFRVLEDPRTADLRNVDVDKLLVNDQYGVGVERYKAILENYGSKSSSVEGLKQLMAEDLLYTNAYRETGENLWYSENCGIYRYKGQLVSFDVKDACEPVAGREWIRDFAYQLTLEKFKEHKRGENFWHTTWTSIYDRTAKKVLVRFQQGNDEPQFLAFSVDSKLS